MGDRFTNFYKNLFLGQAEKGQKGKKGEEKKALKRKKGQTSGEPRPKKTKENCLPTLLKLLRG